MADSEAPMTSRELATALRKARSVGVGYRPSQTAESILASLTFRPQTYHEPMPPQKYPQYEISIHNDIGTRATQEDRLTFCPQLIPGRDDTAFFGVFDGTVGDFASDTVKSLVIPHLVASPPWRRIVTVLQRRDALLATPSCHPALNCGVQGGMGASLSAVPPSHPSTNTTPADMPPPVELHAEATHIGATSASASVTVTTGSSSSTQPTSAQSGALLAPQPLPTPAVPDVETALHQIEEELPPLLWASIQWMYLNADAELVQRCEKWQRHYASSTSVTVLLIGGYCCVGHLGDSRVALGYARDNILFGEFLTSDHKPNLQPERDRIIRSGGTVEYLHNHNSKPFIRGGDFTERKARGEQPMQLQYSRAFGGKDLKMFGLSNEPDIKIFKLTPNHHVLILASDGIWDVQTAAKAVELVLLAKRTGENPAQFLIKATLGQQEMQNQNVDNLTVIVVMLDGNDGTRRHFQASTTHIQGSTTDATTPPPSDSCPSSSSSVPAHH